MKRQLTEAERERIEKNRQEALLRRQRSMESEKGGSVRSHTSNSGADQGQRREFALADCEKIERNRQDVLSRRQISAGVAGTNKGLPPQTSTTFGSRCQKNLPRYFAVCSGVCVLSRSSQLSKWILWARSHLMYLMTLVLIPNVKRGVKYLVLCN